MNSRITRRGKSALVLFGAAALLAGALNQGCVSDSEETIAELNLEPVAAAVQEIKTLDFKRPRDPDYAPVTLPHTMNATNGTGTIPLERGDGYYRYALDLKESDLDKDYIIQFEEVGQTSEVSLNGTLLHTNKCGYTRIAERFPAPLEISDATPAPIERIKGRYRYLATVRTPSNAAFRAFLRAEVMNWRRTVKGVDLYVDVDALSLL